MLFTLVSNDWPGRWPKRAMVCKFQQLLVNTEKQAPIIDANTAPLRMLASTGHVMKMLLPITKIGSLIFLSESPNAINVKSWKIILVAVTRANAVIMTRLIFC